MRRTACQPHASMEQMVLQIDMQQEYVIRNMVCRAKESGILYCWVHLLLQVSQSRTSLKVCMSRQQVLLHSACQGPLAVHAPVEKFPTCGLASSTDMDN